VPALGTRAGVGGAATQFVLMLFALLLDIRRLRSPR